ncbi:MAG TPA: RimK/LysX family protein [Gemmataceae bacterium]|nr:RimK/LysX family protein [Gemmataceae bacterium]
MITAGWREFADFPGLGLQRVRVKLDTGARSAAIGVRHHELIDTAGGQEVELHLAPYRRWPDRLVVVRLPVVGFAVVKSSCGGTERRPVVEIEFQLGPVTKRVRATVADRSRMLVSVLLGRTALAPEFVVDPGRKYLLKREK